jgi:hypothetical protein
MIKIRRLEITRISLAALAALSAICLQAQSAAGQG